MVGHSRPALVGSLTYFFLFHVSLLFCNMRPFKPRGIVALHLFGEYVSSFVPHRVFLVSVSGSVSGYRVTSRLVKVFITMPAPCARLRETKINLMACICLCS